jgi:hypothetical protein
VAEAEEDAETNSCDNAVRWLSEQFTENVWSVHLAIVLSGELGYAGTPVSRSQLSGPFLICSFPES